MDIYSSDRKLSELSMLSNRHHHQQPLLDRHQDFSPSASSSASSTTMTAYSGGSQDFDGGSTFGADVLDFFDSDFGPLNSDSLKVYEEGFGSALNPDIDNDNDDDDDDNCDSSNNNMVNDSNGWLEFLNQPVPCGDPRADLYLHEDGLDFLDGSRIKTEEHSYSLVKDDELTEFKLNFDGDLELFQPAGMMEESEEADDSLATCSGSSSGKVKLDADDGMDEYLFEPDCLAMTDHQNHATASQPGDVNQLLSVVVPDSLAELPLVCPTSLLSSSYRGQQSKQLTVSKRKATTLAAAAATGARVVGTDFLVSLCTVKTEPADYMSQDEMNYSGNMIDGLDEGTMPPTPPSSGCGLNSDSECSNAEMSGPPSPPAGGSRGIAKQPADHHHGGGRHQQPFFSNPIPSSGILILSEEEKRTLLAEGYSLPSKLPLSKQEEKNLKKIRRKIKNKISAQESRRKKKEYLESLEKKVDQITQENSNLKKRINLLESNNRSLITELQKLQSLANKVMKSSSLSSSSSSSLSSST